MNRPLTDREREIRKRAHELAAEGLNAALNMWELDLYYPDPEDQEDLERELLRIRDRIRRQGRNVV